MGTGFLTELQMEAQNIHLDHEKMWDDNADSEKQAEPSGLHVPIANNKNFTFAFLFAL